MPTKFTRIRSRGCGVAVLAMAEMLCLLLIATTVQAASMQGVGVVFLHGKAMWTGAFDGGIPAALEAEGAVAISPEMPWSLGRMYGATYEEAMAEIDAADFSLKRWTDRWYYEVCTEPSIYAALDGKAAGAK